MISSENITVLGTFAIKNITKLEYTIKENEHAQAYVEGMVSKEDCLKGWRKDDKKQFFQIVSIDKKNEKVLFAGYASNIEFVEQNMFYIVKLTLLSGTKFLDSSINSRSFQNINLSYQDIIEKVVNLNQDTILLFTGDSSLRPDKPMIQYMETDWAFILRMASNLKTSVYPDVETKDARLCVGIPLIDKEVSFSNIDYVQGISKKYYENGGSFNGYERADFIYYEVLSEEDYPIGSKATFDGKNLLISRKSVTLEKSVLVFKYTLSYDKLPALKLRYNRIFSGMSILGKIISTKNETVKLHLDIDEEQSEQEAYDYKWVPDTGSTMYCMPQKGTTVSLYFPSLNEQDAIAVNCIRTNGSSCENTKSPDNRYLTTEHGKQLYLKPNEMGLESKEGMEFKMDDENQLFMKSSQTMTVLAVGKIKLSAKEVSMETPSEISIGRKF